MKKLMIGLFLMLLCVSGCAAQDVKVKPPVNKVLSDALVTQVVEETATLTYQGRTFEVDGTFVKGRRYYVILEIVDCDNCPIVRGIPKVIETSIPQAKIDIEKAVYQLTEIEKKYK